MEEFTGCRSNLAANRQTRMLADLALIGCYNSTLRPTLQTDAIMLASAKRNLAAMAFFGLTEYQKVSKIVFCFIHKYDRMITLIFVFIGGSICVRRDVQSPIRHTIFPTQHYRVQFDIEQSFASRSRSHQKHQPFRC